ILATLCAVRFSHGFSAAAGCFAASLLVASCSSPGRTSAPARPAAQTHALWGDMTPVVSVKELMRDMLDPIADNVFDSVKVVESRKGRVETVPQTDADREKN